MPSLSEISDARVSTVRRRLLSWYDEYRRDLPWRKTKDPFAIWISESMLQQTRVDTVIPYYERFLDRFPTVDQLADAELEDVYGLWTGLGYYSRARNLHSAAQTIVNEHAGQLPNTVKDLRKLKGIGPYTAGAVASIAFNKEEPLVDGNVIRVLTRWLDWREDVSTKPVLDTLWKWAGRLVKGERPGDFNQALMELGATVCTPRAPRCLICPIQRSCLGRQAGDPESIPFKPKKKRAQSVQGVAVWIERKGKGLAVRRPEGGLLGGMWELPGGTLETNENIEAGLRRCLHESHSLKLGQLKAMGQIEHLFSHRRLKLHIFQAHAFEGRIRRHEIAEHRWLSPERMAELPQGGPTRKALALLGKTSHESPRSRLKSERQNQKSLEP